MNGNWDDARYSPNERGRMRFFVGGRPLSYGSTWWRPQKAAYCKVLARKC